MDCKPYTGRVHIQFRALQRRCLDWHESVAQELGVEPNDLWIDFQNYAMIATRITPDDKKHSKVFGVGLDNPEVVQDKFLAYLELDVSLITEWEQAIRVMDTPSDESTAPDLETTDPE